MRSTPAILDPALVPAPIELLRLRYAFSQTTLLTERQFRSAARDRGIFLDRSQLELLHRRRLLVPLFQIHERQVGDPEPDLPTTDDAFGTAWGLREAARAGRLTDPAARAVRAWPKTADRTDFLYSHYQLIALRSIEWTIQAARARRVGDEIVWELDRPDSRHIRQLAQVRALAIVLEALSPRYVPRILRVIRGPSDDLQAHIDDRNPVEEESLLRLSPQVLLNQAEFLLFLPFDPLAKWHRVVRIADPGRWKELRFDALLAHEQRVAAEVLLLYYEDLEVQGRAPAMPALSPTWHGPRHDRLKVNERERAETILDFRLSDRPSLVLALEGETEMLVVRRVLDLYGVTEASGLIQCVNLRSVDGDVRLLARAVAVPRLDPQGYVGARVLSPLTALLVAVDPEKNYATPAQRAAQRTAMIDEVMASLPPVLRTTEMRLDLEHMIHVETWGSASFEFSHYSDHELATAMRRLAGGAAPNLSDVKRAISLCRVKHGNLEQVWKRWPVSLSKVALADTMWPVLEKRITRLRPGRRPIPVADVVESAIRHAFHVRRVREVAIPARNERTATVSE